MPITHATGANSVPKILSKMEGNQRKPKRDRSEHNYAGNVRNGASHHRHQAGPREVREKGTNSQRSFSLSHENAGRDIERLRATCAHETRHDSRDLLDDELHHPIVVQHGKKRCDENDRRQNLKSEVEAKVGALFAEVSENK